MKEGERAKRQRGGEERRGTALINTKRKIAPQVNSKKKDSDRNAKGNKYQNG